MNPAEIKTVLLRALRRKSPMTEDELIVTAQAVFGRDAASARTVCELLRDLDDTGLVTREADPDGVLPPSCMLTARGRHKAKQLG